MNSRLREGVLGAVICPVAIRTGEEGRASAGSISEYNNDVKRALDCSELKVRHV